MNQIKNITEKYVFGALTLKIMFILATMVTAVPYLHARYGGLVKFVLAYGLMVVVFQLLCGNIIGNLKKNMSILLVLFGVSYGITILSNRSLNFGANVKALMYMAVFFTIFYIVRDYKDKEQVYKEIKIIASVIILCTLVFSTITISTYIFSISGHYMYQGKFMYYGVYDNRLWGLYNANLGSVINAISIFCSLGFIFEGKKLFSTVVNVINIIVQYTCLVLTLSRAATYAFYLMLCIFIFVMVLKKSSKGETVIRLRALLISFAITVAGFVLILVGSYAIKTGMSYVPSLVKYAVSFVVGDSENSEPVVIEKEQLERIEEVEGREGGIFTGRVDIWQACVKAWLEKPIFGLTRENVAAHAVDNLYNDIWTANVETGGPHNIYVCVLVSSGIVGFLLMMAFALYNVYRMLKSGLSELTQINTWKLILALLVVFFFVIEFVEARILYQVGILYVLFWIFLGYLSELSKKEEE